MKKKTLLIIYLLFTIFISRVNAETIFKYDWRTNTEYLKADYTMNYNHNTYFDKGYVTTTIKLEDMDEEGIPKTYINKYDIEGNLITTKVIENKMILSITSNKDNLIALSVSYGAENDIYRILLLDKELNIEKEIFINIEEDEELKYVLEEFRILGMKYLNQIDDKIYFVTNDYIKEVNLITSKTDNIEYTDENIEKYMNHLYRLEEEQTERKMYFGYDKNNNYEVLTGHENQGCMNHPVSEEVGGFLEESIYSKYPIFTDAFLKPYVACDPEYKATIKIYNNDKLTIEKTYDEYSLFSTPFLINDYIVTIATKMDYYSYEYTVSILILDLKGNIVQEIKEENYYISLVPGPTSFMTIGSNTSSDNNCYIEEKEMSYNCFKNNNIVYYLPLTITTKIEGPGKIDVIEEARYEQLVKYYPLPDENYSLESLSIVDSLNNEIIPNNNTFIMPDKNVVITAKFNVKNPNTIDYIKTFLIIFIVSGLSIIWIKKRTKNI